MGAVFDVMARCESVYGHKISSEGFHMLNWKVDMIQVVVDHLIYTGAKKCTLWHGQVLKDPWALSGRERWKRTALVYWPVLLRRRGQIFSVTPFEVQHNPI